MLAGPYPLRSFKVHLDPHEWSPERLSIGGPPKWVDPILSILSMLSKFPLIETPLDFRVSGARKCLFRDDLKVLLHGDSTTHGLLQEAQGMWSEAWKAYPSHGIVLGKLEIWPKKHGSKLNNWTTMGYILRNEGVTTMNGMSLDCFSSGIGNKHCASQNWHQTSEIWAN